MNCWSFLLTATGPAKLREWLILCLLTVLCFSAPRTATSQEQQIPLVSRTGGANRVSPQTDSVSETERLKAEIRQLEAMLIDLRSHDKGIENYLTFAPEFGLQNEDYAQARLRFR